MTAPRCEFITPITATHAARFVKNLFAESSGIFDEAIHAADIVWYTGECDNDDLVTALVGLQDEVIERTKTKALGALTDAFYEAAREVAAEAVADGRAIAVKRRPRERSK